MKTSFAAGWLAILAAAIAGAAWVGAGAAYVRREGFAAPAIPAASRTEASFLAVLLPRIASAPGKYALSAAELEELLGALKADGCVSISLDDVAEFYAGGRALPPKALLLSFAQDDPRGLALADGVLRDERLRAAAFIARTASGADGGARLHLTEHAAAQMRAGGTWRLGRAAPEGLTYGPSLRFVASDSGVNARDSDPRALRLLALRPGRDVRETAAVVRAAWPRTEPFADEFGGDGLGADWITGWGVVSRGHGRLALIPTPRQSGAGVFLRGTDEWRDAAIEFDLKRFQKEFWSYARYRADGGYVRFGARNGYWYVEQKTGPRGLPTQLARAPILPGALPARVRFVLKGDAAIVHVNGRMQFGRALRVAPAVARGRVLFGVYDLRTRGARAELTSVRTYPLGAEWIAPRRAGSGVFDEEKLDALREESVLATALTPRWVAVAPDGGVGVAETQGALVRSLAGFYGCRLVPTVSLPANAAPVFAYAANADRALAGLISAARVLSADGLNVRLGADAAARPETAAFLARLRAGVRAGGRELWVTVEGPAAPAAALVRAVDGVLRPSDRKWASLEILEPATSAPFVSSPRETASIQ